MTHDDWSGGGESDESCDESREEDFLRLEDFY